MPREGVFEQPILARRRRPIIVGAAEGSGRMRIPPDASRELMLNERVNNDALDMGDRLEYQRQLLALRRAMAEYAINPELFASPKSKSKKKTKGYIFINKRKVYYPRDVFIDGKHFVRCLSSGRIPRKASYKNVYRSILSNNGQKDTYRMFNYLSRKVYNRYIEEYFKEVVKFRM